MSETRNTDRRVYILTVRQDGFVIYESAHATDKDARRMARAIVGDARTVVYTIDAQ